MLLILMSWDDFAPLPPILGENKIGLTQNCLKILIFRSGNSCGLPPCRYYHYIRYVLRKSCKIQSLPELGDLGGKIYTYSKSPRIGGFRGQDLHVGQIFLVNY
jgi:hypothetical protein